MKEIAIIGGGASGLLCAVALKKLNSDLSVTIYEKSDRIGKKLLVTGNGRCNLSNLSDSDDIDSYAKNYNDSEFAKQVISQFPPQETIKFLEELGLSVVYDYDLVYPSTYQASTVVDIFLLAVEKYGVKIVCSSNIHTVKYLNGKFSLLGANNYVADYVVLCGGGRSGNVKENSCYDIAKSLGHNIIETHPSLVPLKCKSPLLKGLNGVRVKASVKLLNSNVQIAVSRGEVLFKDYGISGIAVFQLSAHEINEKSKIEIDLFDGQDVTKTLSNFVANYPNISCYHLLDGVLNKRIAVNVLNALGYTTKATVKSVNLAKVIDFAKHFTLTGLSLLPFEMSQVTRGGVDLSQIQPETMKSTACPQMLIAGELLDINGVCGGYNLQFAFSSGYVAAKTIVKEINKHRLEEK